GLATGISHRNVDHAHAVIGLVHQLLAVAVEVPGIVLARRHPERERPVEDQRRILADVVSAVRMAALDRAVRDGIQHLKPGYDLSCRKGLDNELAVAHLVDEFGKRRACSPQTVETLWKTRRESPLDCSLRNRGRGNCNGTARCSQTSEVPA